VVAARRLGAAEIVDPRPWLVGSLAEVYERYPHIGALVPAMGYSDAQIRELETVINRAPVDAVVIKAASPVRVEDPELVTGKRVLVIEDGPTLTHGEMSYGAGVVAARRLGAAEIVDPRPYLVGSLAEVYERYPHIGALVPAMGYSDAQIRELETVINQAPVDAVVIGTPIDLRSIADIAHPATRVRYDLVEQGQPDLATVLEPIIRASAAPAEPKEPSR
jgi:predicted GTPase